MSNNTKPSSALMFVAIGIAVIQVLDFLIHAATGQIEIIRVTSNGLILMWLALSTSNRFNAKALPVSAVCIGGYLILNLVFLAQEGLTNPEQGGGLRIALFLFVLLTVSLSAWLAILVNRRRSDQG